MYIYIYIYEHPHQHAAVDMSGASGSKQAANRRVGSRVLRLFHRAAGCFYPWEATGGQLRFRVYGVIVLGSGFRQQRLSRKPQRLLIHAALVLPKTRAQYTARAAVG